MRGQVPVGLRMRNRKRILDIYLFVLWSRLPGKEPKAPWIPKIRKMTRKKQNPPPRVGPPKKKKYQKNTKMAQKYDTFRIFSVFFVFLGPGPGWRILLSFSRNFFRIFGVQGVLGSLPGKRDRNVCVIVACGCGLSVPSMFITKVDAKIQGKLRALPLRKRQQTKNPQSLRLSFQTFLCGWCWLVFWNNQCMHWGPFRLPKRILGQFTGLNRPRIQHVPASSQYLLMLKIFWNYLLGSYRDKCLPNISGLVRAPLALSRKRGSCWRGAPTETYLSGTIFRTLEGISGKSLGADSEEEKLQSNYFCESLCPVQES